MTKNAFKLIKRDNGETVVPRLRIADTIFTRARGLLGRGGLDEDEGLLIRPCRMVHMFFMKFPIDVVFCSANGTVISMHTLRPWQWSSYEGGAEFAIELAEGKCERCGIRRGIVLSQA